MVWESLAIKLAIVAAGSGLLVLMVKGYGREREKKAAANAKADVLEEGAKRHAKMDEIHAEPVPTGEELRARMRARLERVRRRMHDRLR